MSAMNKLIWMTISFADTGGRWASAIYAPAIQDVPCLEVAFGRDLARPGQGWAARSCLDDPERWVVINLDGSGLREISDEKREGSIFLIVGLKLIFIFNAI